MRYLALTLLLLSVSSTALAQGSLYYVGVGLGISDAGDAAANVLDDGSFAKLNQESRDQYFELILGARLNHRFYLELAQQQLGGFSAKGSSDGSAFHAAGLVSGELDISLTKVSLLAKLVGEHRVNGYLRLGIHRNKLEQQISSQTGMSVEGSGLLYGLGVGMIANSNWQLQLEMVRYQGISYQNVVSGKEDEFAINTLGVRALYLF